MLYSILLPLHSVVRWLVVIVAVLTVGRALLGWLGRKEWAALDERLGMLFPMALDIQTLLGLLLYFFASPLTMGALSNFGAAMQNTDARFFAVEHVFTMVLALVVAHVGRARSRKATDALVKHRTAAIFFGVAVLMILSAIPWARPLLPFGG